MKEVDWQTLEELLRQAKFAYYAGDDQRFHALAYMLQVATAGLKDAYLDRPERGGFVYPAGAQEVQIESVRESRQTDRTGDTGSAPAT